MAYVQFSDIEVEIIPDSEPAYKPRRNPFSLSTGVSVVATYKYGRKPVLWQPNNWAFLTHPVTLELPIERGRIYDFVELRVLSESFRMASVQIDSIEWKRPLEGKADCVVSMRCPASKDRHGGMMTYA